MNRLETDPFVLLFRAAYRKCYNSDLRAPLSEAESRHLSNEILEKTGLVIGAKSIKNYSIYAVGKSEGKPENPSVATLDTFARYVLHGPYTDEPARKKTEGHFPYWFRFKSSIADQQVLTETAQSSLSAPRTTNGAAASGRALFLIFALLLLGAGFCFWYFAGHKPATFLAFTDRFEQLSTDSLAARGWVLQNRQDSAWNKRADRPGVLQLFTLPGDNWADSSGRQGIRNLLIRAVPADCFSAEIHLDGFFPVHNWQQAGMLLMEDSSGKGRSLRVSLAYNSFFGGFVRPPEIYLQAITATADDPGKPEEIVHLALFTLNGEQTGLVRNNMQHAAIRIEKTGDRFRILYAAGPVANFAFREALSKEIPFKPRYLGIFALEGFVADTDYQAVAFSYFALRPETCP